MDVSYLKNIVFYFIDKPRFSVNNRVELRKKSQFNFTVIISAMLAIMLTGCAGIPLNSAYKMMTADPVEFHPEKVAVAVQRSNLLQLNTGDVVMGLKITSKDKAEHITQEYFLEVDNTPVIPPVLQQSLAGSKLENKLTVLKLSSADIERMKALQAKMREYNRIDKEVKFGFYVSVLRGCKNAVNIPKNVYLTLFLRLDTRDDYFMLYEGYDIGQADLAPLKNLKDWAFCSPALVAQSLAYKKKQTAITKKLMQQAKGAIMY